ncbi:MAG: rhamnogalacturonan acetylesterase [Edaphobacter sp.]|uniref:rhamnogalacturonan acetylesterase n=1 Tax=Edaphobacter sp. TaxID=1934404 RepID=UPI00239CD2BA|nr:rhamnogalacturonan acetylesterase [Edaphobacter sp.]MDE1177512.1 rhamnogalacturonan acetylesterase [Edaphobacter sp.]
MFKVVLPLLCLAVTCSAQTFLCGAGKSAPGTTVLQASTIYSDKAAGFDLEASPAVSPSGCSSESGFFFSVPLEEGNYRVTVVLGGSYAAVTTVRAEARRLMLFHVATAAGKTRTESFVVNVRRPEIAGSGGRVVKRKPRELNSLNWDDKLTLEFAGTHPSVRSIRIQPADPATPTVYLAGDSTVVDQDNEPWAAWGQMLPGFFGPELAIANDAESGETIASFEGEGRFAKIFSTLHRGDYLFIQFAHNDQKPGKGYVSPERYEDLLQKYTNLARSKGATPVLVTSMNRRTYDRGGHVTDTLAPYPQTMKKLADADHVSLIDLNAMSKILYEAVGEAKSKSLFVYADANTYPGQIQPLHDDTHFDGYGAYELARCVVLGIQQAGLPLTRQLRQPSLRFNPAKPDSLQSVVLPVAPFFNLEKPYER